MSCVALSLGQGTIGGGVTLRPFEVEVRCSDGERHGLA